ncbi:hypothetical protein CSA37_02540 [Candidatus Fermentibacteria bacterium]|nr:MAG: hypothetical protein CSA37_02540 [Candidatus Fermentibacteria bacterium]
MVAYSAAEKLLTSKTVLVVDDEDQVREFIALSLSDMSSNVIEVNSVSSAKEVIENSDIDVVISDIAMPGNETGIDLLSWCRERDVPAPFILISGYVTPEAARFALSKGVQFVIHKPFKREQLQEAVMSSFVIRDSYGNLVERYVKEIERSNELFLATVDGFAAAVGARDGYTLEHSRQVSWLAVLLSKKLGLDEKFIRSAGIAGQLHDIGKIGVPERILLKREPLTRAEFSIMKTHAEKGAEILSPVPNLSDVTLAVRHHHERFDGKGYPDALSRSGIPLLARILAVCDAYSAMITERPYRSARPASAAREEIRNDRGKQFDPEIVDAFLSILEILAL